jgi:hypothetical protein
MNMPIRGKNNAGKITAYGKMSLEKQTILERLFREDLRCSNGALCMIAPMSATTERAESLSKRAGECLGDFVKESDPFRGLEKSIFFSRVNDYKITI